VITMDDGYTVSIRTVTFPQAPGKRWFAAVVHPHSQFSGLGSMVALDDSGRPVSDPPAATVPLRAEPCH
jgi:hypothetical protein